MSEAFIGQTVGGFRITRQIGRGGMGLVFEAEEVALRNRRVALKILPLAFSADPTAAARFQREAEIAASLDHPNIIPVYAVGEETGLCYYAMKYVEGWSLAEALGSARHHGLAVLAQTPRDLAAQQTIVSEEPPHATVPLAEGPADQSRAAQAAGLAARETDAEAETRFRKAAEIICQAADGLEYAHRRDVVHRDIKPANLMIDTQGTVLIADFGLATDVQSQTLTAPGSMMGTPAYMSPEQVVAATVDIDHRTDIYSLGATLYELLTLAPPFEAETRDKLLQQIVLKEPRPPRARSRRMPIDLDTITTKALEKDVSRRYQSAHDMAEDLRRFLAGEPISARPVGLITRAVKRLKRDRPLVAALTAAVSTAVVVAAAALMYGQAQWRKQTAATRDAARQLDAAHWEAYQRFGQAGDPVGELLVAAAGGEHVREHGLPSRHAWEGAAVEALNRCPRMAVDMPLGHGWGGIAFAPAGYRLAGAGAGSATVWDLAGEPEALRFTGHLDVLRAVSFSPDGRMLASGSDDNTVRVWHLADRRELATLQGHEGAVGAVTFSPDGRTVASAGKDGTVRLWDVATGRETATLRGHADEIAGLDFRPDGAALASASGDGTVRLWDPDRAEAITTIQAHIGGATSVCFSPDGQFLASGGHDSLVRIWDANAGVARDTLRGHSNAVRCVAFSPDDDALVSGGDDGIARLWDLETRRQKAVLRGVGKVKAVAFSADGAALSILRGYAIELWELPGRLPTPRPLTPATKVRFLRSSPDGSTCATLGTDYTIRLWDTVTGRERIPLARCEGSVRDLVFCLDGAVAIAVGHTSVRRWDVATGHERTRLRTEAEEDIGAWGLSADRRTLAWVDSHIRVWDLATGRETVTMEPMESVRSVALTPRGNTLATLGRSGTIRLWDATTGRFLAKLRDQSSHVPRIAACPDPGRPILASIDGDGTIDMWDMRTGRERAGLRLRSPRGGTWSIRFSPDGDVLAAVNSTRSRRVICLVDLESRRNRATLDARKDVPRERYDARRGAEQAGRGSRRTSAEAWQMRFSPDGSALACLDSELLIVWDVATGRRKEVIRDLGDHPHFLGFEFAADNAILAWTDDGGSPRLWRVPSDPISSEQARRHSGASLGPDMAVLHGRGGERVSWTEGHPLHWASDADTGAAQALHGLALVHERRHEDVEARALHAKAAAATGPGQTGWASASRRRLDVLPWLRNPTAFSLCREAWDSYGRQDYGRSLTLCDEARALDPEQADQLGRELSWAFARDGEDARQKRAHDMAERLLRHAIRLGNSQRWVHNSLGRTLWRGQRDAQGAVQQFRRAIELAPGWRPVHGNLGQVLEAKRNFAEALPHYRERASGTAEYGSYARIKVGLLAARLGDFDEAIASLQRCVRLKRAKKADAVAAEHLASVYCLAGRHQDARSTLEGVREKQAASPRRKILLALCAHATGDVQAAASHLGELLPSDDVAVASQTTTRDLLDLGLPLQRAFDAATAANSDLRRRARTALAMGHAGIAVLCARAGDEAGTGAACDRALGLAPDCAAVYRYTGIAYTKFLRMPERGVELSRKALELDPDDVYARNHLGWGLYLMGDYDEAMEENRRALAGPAAAPPKLSAYIHANVGLLHLIAGELPEAAASFERSADLAPQEIHHAAILKLRELLAKRSDLPGIHYTLALLYDRQQDEAGARDHYGRFVKAVSTGELALRARERLAELSPGR